MNKIKKQLYLLLGLVGFWFLGIFLTVYLTGGRETYEFTEKDSTVFSWFIMIELLVTVVFLVLMFKSNGTNTVVPKKQNSFEKMQNRRGNVILVLSWLLSLCVYCLGIVFSEQIKNTLGSSTFRIMSFLCILPIVFLALNIVLGHLYTKRIKSMRVEEAQVYYLKHRENAEKTSAEKLALLKKIIVMTDIYALILFFIGVLISFTGGAAVSTEYCVYFVFYSTVIVAASGGRIRLSTPSVIYEEDEGFVTEKEYPILYAHAKNAAEKLGCKKSIKIYLMGGCNAGGAMENGYYNIYLGVILLAILNEQELYTILLHEFAHASHDENNVSKETMYGVWLGNGGYPNFVSGITRKFFTYFDVVYLNQNNLYRYSYSIINEKNSDKAMVLYGDSSAAVSALIKIKYYNLFCYEKGTYDTEPLWIEETLSENYFLKEVTHFKERLDIRKDDWNSLIDVEILSRSATHPTLKMRLETLGCAERRVFDFDNSGPYYLESEKALIHINRLALAQMTEEYEKIREREYILPLKTIEEWESEGRPLTAENYSDIITNLRSIGRITEAEEVAERVIKELPEMSAAFAYYMKGCSLIHKYKEEGLEYIYHAMRMNPNYIDEGVSLVGEFCCLTGNQKELDSYRQKAVVLGQNVLDKYNKLGFVDKKDKLVSEKLPDGMLERILEYISSVENGTVSDIYLFRKIITDDFFTSVFVIRFLPQTDGDSRYEVLHKIFNHLDNGWDWQFSLFDFDDIQRVDYMKLENCCVFTRDKL